MIVLAIDTAASLCAACVYETGRGERGRSVLDIGKGHAEHLMATIGEALAAAACTLPSIDAIAVSVGPGSFTGVRVGVATARGLALALGRPAVSVSTLEAIAAEAAAPDVAAILVALDAGREQVYLQRFDAAGIAAAAPVLASWDEAAALAAQPDVAIAGTAATRLAGEAGRGAVVLAGAATADIATYARLGAARLAAGGQPPRPVPLYLRAADAKPQAGFAVARKGPA